MGNATSCPSPHNTQDLHHQGTSHKILLILSTACTAITLCSAAALATLHLFNYRAPKEQRQIVKILLAPFVFALVSLAQILAYPAAAYLDPISSAYEAVCLCALFLLYVQFAAGPGKGTFGEELFEAVRAAQETSAAAGDGDGDGDGRGRRGNWPKATWAAVFQYPVTELIAIVVLEVTEATGTYCSTSLRPRYGHFWASLIHSVGLVVAVVSLVRFYGRMKGRMRARRGLAKLGCFKAMVALRFLQTWIFNILIDQDVLQPSSVFSYGDLLYGLPNALLCVESIVFSAVFWYAFSATEYRNHPEARLGVWKAGLDAANPLDLLRGITRAVGLVASFSRRQEGEIAPMRRADRGKYRTLEGMESLERPDRSRSRTPLGEFEGRGGRYTEV